MILVQKVFTKQPALPCGKQWNVICVPFFFFNKFIYLLIYLFIYFWLRWVFVAARGLSLVAVSGGCSSLPCTGSSLPWLLVAEHRLQVHGPQQLWHTGSVVVARGIQSAGSVAVAHGLSCSAACGIFPDQGSNPCALHWQADSQPLRHQGSPVYLFKVFLGPVGERYLVI